MPAKLKQILRNIRNTLQLHYYQRNYYIAKILPPAVPRRPLSFLPNGFKVEALGDSGVYMIDAFCSKAGSSYLLARAAELSNVTEEPESATVFSASRQDQVLLPLLYRAAMLSGTRVSHMGIISVTKVAPGSNESLQGKQYPRSDSKPLGYICIFLENEGELHFPEVGLGVRAAIGRAVFWPADTEAVAGGADAFPVCRFAVDLQPVFQPDSYPEVIPQAQRGVALDGSEAIPDGAWFYQDNRSS